MGALDSHQSLKGIKALRTKQVIIGKYVMTLGTILENGKQISIATLHAFINLYNRKQMEIITWDDGKLI